MPANLEPKPIAPNSPARENNGRAIRLGEGRLSGALSAALGLMSLGGVLCFMFPNVLTTPEVVAKFDVWYLRLALLVTLIGAFACGAICFFINNKSRVAAFVGMAAALVATLFGGAGAQKMSGIDFGFLPLGLDWLLLDLLFSAMLFVPLEKVLPLRREQPVLRADWEEDLLYFAMTHLLISVLMVATTASGPMLFGWAVNDGVQGAVRWLWWPVQLFLCLFVADLAQYVTHRWYHKSKVLWRMHAVHHSSETMDWLAGSRLHFAEVLVTRVAVLAPLYIAGFEQSVLYTYIGIVGFQAVFIHANVGINFGWLRFLVVTPQYHHWHHAAHDEAIDKNFAVHLPLLDMMFGTYYQPKGKWPEKYGLAHGSIPRGIVSQHLYPFTGAKKDAA